jgi:hypothetical protein
MKKIVIHMVYAASIMSASQSVGRKSSSNRQSSSSSSLGSMSSKSSSSFSSSSEGKAIVNHLKKATPEYGYGDIMENLTFKPFGWYDPNEKDKKVYVATTAENAQEGAIMGMNSRTYVDYIEDKEKCVDQFVSIGAFDRTAVNRVLKAMNYDVCVPPAKEYEAPQYEIETFLDCGQRKWIRLDCIFTDTNKPEEHFFASRLAEKSASSKTFRAVNDFFRGDSDETLFRNRMRCGDKENANSQQKECQSLLLTFVEMEKLFDEEKKRKEAMRSGKPLPSSSLSSSQGGTTNDDKTSDNTELIMLVVGGIVVALGIGIALFVFLGGNKSASGKKKVKHDIDSDNPPDEPEPVRHRKSSKGKHHHHQREDKPLMEDA